MGATSNPTEALNSRPQLEKFMDLVKRYRPAYIWGWPLYIDYMKGKLGKSKLECNGGQGVSPVESFIGCLDKARGGE